MSWSDAYIGLPFEEKGRGTDAVDCWGLALRVLLDQRSIDTLPSYTEDYVSTAERAELAAIFARDCDDWPWCEVTDAQPFDIALFNRAGVMCHVGIVVEPGLMLHVEAGCDSCLERFDGGRWLARFAGLRRHVSLP
jgi:cell wall-associated NlpC family hydrolase